MRAKSEKLTPARCWIIAGSTGGLCGAWILLSPISRVLWAAALGCASGVAFPLTMSPAWRATEELPRSAKRYLLIGVAFLGPVAPTLTAMVLRLQWVVTLLAEVCVVAVALAFIISWQARRDRTG